MEEFTGLRVDKKQFELKKIKLDRVNECAEISFVINVVSNNGAVSTPGTLSPGIQVAESFKDKVRELKPYLCSMKKLQDTALAKSLVIVEGINVSGVGDKKTYIIKGVQQDDGKRWTRFDSSKTHFSENEFAHNEQVKEITEALRDEAFNYLFAGKQLEISMGLDDGESAETTEDAEVVE
jgi:hypothetical protein